MDISTISALISSVGFPIACCVFCGYYITTTMKDFSKTIENNTLVIQKLLSKLGKDESENE